MMMSPIFFYSYADYEPFTFVEANKEECWWFAMEEEIRAIQKNNTWELMTLPQNYKVISIKWIYKIKHAANSKIDRYKMRLVTKGYK